MGQTFRAEPKPLAIVGQELKRRASAVAKDIDRAAQGILMQQPGDRAPRAHRYPSEVDRLHGQKDATLGRELEHQWESRKVWSKGTRRRGVTVRDAQPGAIGPLDFDFRRGRPPGRPRLRQMRDVGRGQWRGRAIQGLTPSFERMGREAQLVGDPRDGEGGRERHGAAPTTP